VPGTHSLNDLYLERISYKSRDDLGVGKQKRYFDQNFLFFLDFAWTMKMKISRPMAWLLVLGFISRMSKGWVISF